MDPKHIYSRLNQWIPMVFIKFIFALLLVAFYFPLFAFNDTQTEVIPLVIENDRESSINLGRNILVLPNEDSPADIESVLKIPDSAFYSSSQWKKIYPHKNAWLKFKIVNNTDDPISDYIFITRDFDSLKVYTETNGSLSFLTLTGRYIHPSDRFIPATASLFPIHIQPGDSTVFYALGTLNEKVSSDQYWDLTLSENLYSYIHDKFYQNILYAFFTGIMILFSVFSLVMFLSFRERIFVYYALFMFFITFYFLSINRLLQLYLQLPPDLLFSYITGIFISGIVLSSYYFFSHYLNLETRMSKFNLGYKIMAFCIAIVNVTHYYIFSNSQTGYDVSNSLIIVYFLLTFIPIVYLVSKKVKEAKVLLFSTLLLFLGGTTFTLMLLRIIPNNVFSFNSFQLGAIACSGTLFYGLFDKINSIQSDKLKFRIEKEKTDELLFNILPAQVAMELKENGFCEAKDYHKVTVLFTDFKDFTATSTTLSAKELVNEINACFIAFDQIVEKYQVEKIKTIGDSYMAAGGLQNKPQSNVRDVVLAGIEMQEFLVSRKKGREVQNLQAFEMRVGIHTGPVVAGIVGVKKFQYDIWGDTVNTASRTESYGEVGKVNISDTTYSFLKDDPVFAFEERSSVEVKGKGITKMWFVSKKNKG